ncbi:MAG: oligosaccharide flippase family protein [Calditrichaeota bacterium]|nr:oligosaccharide flippase family protein [Candidatus Cloacimonadota bacterium]MCA9787453.1 oligosaccharide flippase family protein [Candidatus Cloacimonadota bacterium]MCB1048088.1 oligosaccharide flippase family protein [Calditrichota bacterium]MCB9472563.1 oligosaccharide flippase family protein [Candidatus Delongbacteria bacterium]
MRKESLGGQVLGFGAGSLLQKSLGALLIPLYIHALKPEGLGTLALIELVSSLALILIGLGIPHAMVRMASSEERQLANLLRTGVNPLLLSGIGSMLLLQLLAPFVILALRLGPESVLLLRITLITLPLLLLQRVFESLWRIQRRARRYSLVTTMGLGVTLVLTVAFLLGLGMAVEGILWARFWGALLVVAVGLADYGGLYLRGRTDRALRNRLLAFSLPIVPHKLNMVLNNSVDRLLLQYMIGPAAVGLYDLGARVGVLIQRAMAPFEMAYIPWMFRRFDRKQDSGDASISIVSNGMLVLIAAGTLVLGIAGPWAVDLLDHSSKFALPRELIPVLTLGFAVMLCYNVVSIPIFTAYRTKVMPLISGSTALLNIVCNLLWIPEFGVMGAAWATLASNLLMFLVGYLISRRLQKIPCRNGLLAMGSAAGLVLWRALL